MLDTAQAGVIYSQVRAREKDHYMPAKRERVAEAIREKIRAGELKKGDRLPPTAQLLEEYGLGYGTWYVVLTTLKAEGLLRGEQGVGVFVTGKKPPKRHA